MCKTLQGGIYNLPTHLSHGARDLIPRMLVVDPLKRITIPEIRCALVALLLPYTNAVSDACKQVLTSDSGIKRSLQLERIGR